MSKAKDRTFSIYKITNNVNGKVYVGQSINPSARKARHFGTRCDNKHLKASIKKYTEVMFSWDIIESGLTQDQVDEREKYWIAFYDCMEPKGYNIMAGGQQSRLVGKRSTKKGKKTNISPPHKDGTWGNHTEEAKEKIKEASIERALNETEEHKLKRVKEALQSKLDNPNFEGFGPPPEWKGKELPHKAQQKKGVRDSVKKRKLKEIGIDFEVEGNFVFNLHHDTRKESLKKKIYNEISFENDYTVIEGCNKPLIVMDVDAFIDLYKMKNVHIGSNVFVGEKK